MLRGLFFAVPRPCPWSVERCRLFCTERGGRERGGEGLASFGLLCQHDVRSLSEATEGGAWGLEVGVGSV